MLAGIVIQTAAQTSAHILSKTLTDRYLLRANTTYFEPRGLKVRLMKTPAMRYFVGIDRSEEKSSKFKKFLKGAEKVVFKVPIPIIGPIIGRTIMQFSDNPVSKILLHNPFGCVDSPAPNKKLGLVQGSECGPQRSQQYNSTSHRLTPSIRLPRLDRRPSSCPTRVPHGQNSRFTNQATQ